MKLNLNQSNMEKTELITVPTFNFNQGDVLEGGEQPIQVCYYNVDLVELTQEGKSIIIRHQDLDRLFKEIKRHIPEAKSKLEQ